MVKVVQVVGYRDYPDLVAHQSKREYIRWPLLVEAHAIDALDQRWRQSVLQKQSVDSPGKLQAFLQD